MINIDVFKLPFRFLKNIILTFLKQKIKKVIYGFNNELSINGMFTNVKIEILGNNNWIEVKHNAIISNCLFYIKGSNNNIVIDENVVIYNGELWIENNFCTIAIGNGTTIQKAHLASVENESKIIIGKDCMLSTDVEIRTSDSHSIIDNLSNKRINPASNVIIKDHVWIGSKVTVLKGVVIETGSVIGASSLVTKSIPKNHLAAGVPAKIIKGNINWIRERI